MIKIHPRTYEFIAKCYYHIGRNSPNYVRKHSFSYFMEDVDHVSPSKKFDIEDAMQRRGEELEKDPSMNNESINERLSSEFNPNSYYDPRYKKGDQYYVNGFLDYVIEYLKSLNNEDIFKLLNRLFTHREFWEMKNDSWNYLNHFVKHWREDLITYLKLSGIIYDYDKKELKEINNELNVQGQVQLPDLITNVEMFEENVFYKDLSREINKCYQMGLYTAVFVLSRKLLENLLIDVLRKKYPENEGDNIDIYWWRNAKRFHDFSVLLKNLEVRKSEFGIDEGAVDEFLKRIKPFKLEANSSIHSIIIQSEKEDIDKFKIEHMLVLLLRLNENIP